MENTGLKEYLRSLEVGLPLGKAYINLCPQQNNVILDIPLIEEMGISFLFNYLKKNEMGSMGKGGHISLFRKLQYNNVWNSDFTSDEYNLGELNAETGLMLTKVKNPPYNEDPTYELKDKNNTIIRYKHPNTFDYPTEVVDEKNNKTTYSFENNLIRVTSKYSVVELDLRPQDKLITEIRQIKDYIVTKKIRFEYTDKLLTSIIFVSPRNEEKTIEYDIIHDANSFEVMARKTLVGKLFVFDNLSKRVSAIYKRTYIFNRDIEEIEFYHEKEEYLLSFDTNNNIAAVTDSAGKKGYYFFERRNIRGGYFNSLYVSGDGCVSTDEINNSLKPLYQAFYDKSLLSKALFSNLTLDDFSSGTTRNYQPTELEKQIISDTARILETNETRYDWPVNANGGDVFTLTCLAKAVNDSAEVILHLGEDGKKINVSNNWKLLCVETNISEYKESLRLAMETTSEIVVGAINLFKKSFATFYTYDNNVVSDGKSSTFTNINGLIESIVDENGVRYGLEYNDDKDLTKFKTSNGVVVENTYNENHQLVQQEIRGKDNALRNTKEYDQLGRVVYESDGNPYATTTYSYDEFGSLTSVAKATLVNERVYNEYGDLRKIIARPFNCGITDPLEVTYDYDEINPSLVKKISLSNNTHYKFEYDNFNRVKELYLNDVCIFKYQYNSDDTDKIYRQYFGNNSDFFEFDYYDSGEIRTSTYSAGNLSYEYLYDGFDRLTDVVEHRDGNAKVLEHYSYNEQNELVKIENSVKKVNKIFDNNGKETQNKISINGKEIIHEYDSVERAKGSNLEMVFDELQQNDGYSVATFVGDNNCVGGKATYSCHYRKTKNNAGSLTESTQLYISEPSYVGNIPCVYSSSRIAFAVKDNTNTNLQKQTVAFWFKTSTHKNNGCLFYTKSRLGGCSLALFERYIIGRYCFEVVVTDTSNNSHTVLSTLSHDINEGEDHFSLNKWTFIALTCAVENGAMIVKLQVDGLKFESTLNQIDFTWRLRDSNLEMNIGYAYDYQATENQITNSYDRAHFALIAIGNKKSIDDVLIDRYFKRTKDYIIDNTLTGGDNISDCSITRLIKDPTTSFGTFKVFPLENNLFSLDYDSANPDDIDKPSKFDLRKGYKTDKDPVFNFDENLKKYVFVADGKKLAYRAKLGNSGTIAASFYFDDFHRDQYIFDIKNGNCRISLIKDGSHDQLRLVVDNNGAITTKAFQCYALDNCWQNIAFSFDRRVQTDYFGTTYSCYVRILCGTVVLEQDFSDFPSLDDAEIMLGRSFTANSPDASNDAEKYSALSGRITNFAYNKAYNSESTIRDLFAKLASGITGVKFFNDIGLLRKEEISKSGNLIFGKEYDGTTCLYRETFLFKNNQEESRNYSYDNLGNVTYISSSDGQSFGYSYDYQGFLYGEEHYGGDRIWYRHYTYDSNGNLLSRIGETRNDKTTGIYIPYEDVFQYDPNSPDKLISVNNEPVHYDPLSPGNIDSIGAWKYKYQGRRLVEATMSKTMNDRVYGTITKVTSATFTYDDKGLRKTKIFSTKLMVRGTTIQSQSVKTEYEYDGNLLIHEKSSNNRELFFLYDENKQLYGYILNGVKYFYMKDFLNNILGLIDENGEIVAKYYYDAYGYSLGSDYYNNQAIYNPIGYKGYYHDSEIDMYYCKSRYYVPKLCRWLNMDNPNFLEEDNTSRLNLFAYCAGNPVMNYDPDGHLPTWLKWLAGGLAVVGVALAVAGVCVMTCGVGALAGTLAGAVIFGAAKGAVIGAAIGVVAGAVVGGATTNWSLEGVLVGAGIGVGAGAIIGAIIGGASGAGSYFANSKYITQTGGDVKQVLSAYKGNPKLINVSQGTKAYRVWGGEAKQFGQWLSPKNYGQQAISKLALNPEWGNTAANVTTFTFNQNVMVLAGHAAPQASLAGGGIQWFISCIAALSL